jgi:hypothetical protein
MSLVLSRGIAGIRHQVSGIRAVSGIRHQVSDIRAMLAARNLIPETALMPDT